MTKSILALIILLTIILSSCANKVSPEGGAIDHEPPIIEKIIPENGSINFSAKEIVFSFDEFIELNDPSQNIFISPPLSPKPEFTVSKKQLKIKLPDSIRIGVTYTINFGNAIVDLHEGNALTDFKYVFSTGNSLDSLKISGNIFRADNLKPEKSVIAVMYNATLHDSLMFKVLPDYYARVKEDGAYSIENIKPGLYKFGAIADANSNYLAETPREWIAFSENQVVVPSTEKNELLIFPQSSVNPRPVGAKNLSGGKIMVAFNGNGNGFTFGMLNGSILHKEWNALSDTAYLYCNLLSDSVGVLINSTELIDTLWTYRKLRPSEQEHNDNKLLLIHQFRKNNDSLILVFSKPFKHSGEGTVMMNDKKVKYIINYDGSDYAKSLSIKKPDSTSLMIIEQGTFMSYQNIYNDTLRSEIFVLSERQTGIIEIKIVPFESHDTYVQIIDASENIFDEFFIPQKGTYLVSGIVPGKYTMRAFKDENDNKVWDTGNYYLQKQPEEVKSYIEEIVIRANWTIQLDWDVNKINE